MAFRGFTRRMQRNGAWFSRLGIAGDGATPVYPPLSIKPTAAPSGAGQAGDVYVGADGVLRVHNGTRYLAGGGGPVVLVYMVDAGTAVDRQAFIADRAYQLVSVEEVHVAASTSGTLDLKKCTGTQAPGSGTTMLDAVIGLSGAANTTVAGTLSGTGANTKLEDGDRIAFTFGGTVTNLAGACVTVVLQPI